ncbi:MAG: tripartite tricarboxylate transporter permease [Alphaproteobacteria bacterium]|nr:tripartite tricarboxylate transporter permease [Alphaproteobacteria bacterium]
MTDILANLAIGFGEALSLTNLAFCLIGVLVGTLVGVLPGIGPLATVAMLLPITFALQPVTALIMLSGIYYGAQYGGSTTAILVNLPGEASSVVTCLDGYQMARRGRAGAALAVAALGSFFAGTVATVLIVTVAEPMTELALRFGPAEYFSLMVFGLIGAVVLASGSVVNALAMIVVGLLLGLIGIDVNSGAQRYTFGIPNLSDGISFVTIALGLFGIGDIVLNLERGTDRSILATRLGGLWLTRAEARQAAAPVVRGTLIGSMLGVLPGGGAVLSAFAAYTAEKKLARDPTRFGHGAIEGVAAPEAANNAGAQTSFIPMLTLGIPSNALMALMIGALIMHGIQPGPQVLSSQPTLFWGLIASMWIGNLMLLVINLPLIGIWVALLKVPYRLLYTAILVFSAIGVYSIGNSVIDVFLTAVFGLLGYFFLKVGAEPAPLLLGFVLGPMMEENLRRAMLISGGDPMTFVERPISLGLLLAAAGLLALALLPKLRRARAEAFKEA